MKQVIFKNILLACSFFGVAQAYSQKFVEESAVMEYKNRFSNALDKKDYPTARKGIVKAKELIDQAAAHPDTENSQRTLLYKAKIYTGVSEYAAIAKDSSIFAELGADLYAQGIQSYKKGYEIKGKLNKDIAGSVVDSKRFLYGITKPLSDSKQYASLLSVYTYQVDLSNAVNNIDTAAIYNMGSVAREMKNYEVAAAQFEKCAKLGYYSADSYALAIESARFAENDELFNRLVKEGRTKFPASKDILFQLIDFKIQKGDTEGANASLKEAVAIDSTNKTLYYIIADIQLRINNYTEAEQAINKALQLDPNYLDALYQLGAIYNIQGVELRERADKLPLENKRRYDALNAKADEYFQKSLVPLEKYIALSPKDASVLQVLVQVTRHLDMTEKSSEYSKRLESIRGNK